MCAVETINFGVRVLLARKDPPNWLPISATKASRFDRTSRYILNCCPSDATHAFYKLFTGETRSAASMHASNSSQNSFNFSISFNFKSKLDEPRYLKPQ